MNTSAVWDVCKAKHRTANTDLAQPGEHLSYKQKVTGSNPVVDTKIKSKKGKPNSLNRYVMEVGF